ncbi:MAG: hypothetical protein KIT09_19365 [Bryobacteraceae bacterium]|nr:hypothetical protein [Bryobacteraceae bacterium]
MARSRGSARFPTTIPFRRQKSLLARNSAAGIAVAAGASAEVMRAIRADAPFPDRDIDAASVSLEGEGGKDIEFGDGPARVSFRGKANALAGLGIYSKPAAVREALGSGAEIAAGLSLPENDGHRYLVLRWGYDVKASARGSMALGGFPGAVKFGVEAASDGLFAVVQHLPAGLGARSAIQRAVDAWRPLRSIASPADLDRGTWLAAEVDGALALKLGATFGHDLNWVRAAELGGLAGDIGLRIQLGLSAQLGFSAGGKYCVVAAREPLEPDARTLRLRVSRLATKGWNFALNAAAAVTGDFGVLPDQPDQFIRGVFGLHGAQVVKTLQAVEAWADPARPLPDQLAGLGADYMRALLTDLTGVDAAAEFDAARQRLLSLFKAWDDLPARASSMLWKLVEEEADLSRLRAMLAAAADPKSLQDFIEKRLARADFFRRPEGRLLESLALGGVFGALSSRSEFQALQEAAAAVRSILVPDGASLRVLAGLQKFVNQALDIDKLRTVATKIDFDALDAMLRKKVSEFLGKTFDFSDVDTVRRTIQLLLGKREEFYSKTIRALKGRYNFEFAAAWARAASDSALLDVEFDFGAARSDLATLWQAALDGEFTNLLLKSRRDVSLRAGVLTHGVRRHTHVDVSLPFYKGSAAHINEALAKATAVDEHGGRVIVYELRAEDAVHSSAVLPWKKIERDSRLTVGAFLPVEAAGGRLRVHSTGGLTYAYSYDQARRHMKRAELQYQLKPLVEQYLADCFPPGAAPFDTWISDLDRTIDAIEDNGSDNFGNTLVSLDLTLPGRVPAAWLRAPASKNDPAYAAMSENIQASLKRLLAPFYFQDPGRYAAAQPPACALLVYAAMPPIVEKSLHWDYLDDRKRRAAIFSKAASTNLAVAIHQVSNLLASLGRPRDAAFYAPGELGKIQKSGDGPLLIGLLRMEAEIVGAAARAGRRMAEFRAASAKNPQQAIEALEEFGAALTKAFNAKVSSIYGGGALRPLGTMIFLEAARAFDADLAPVRPAAMLQLTVLKESAAFPPPGFPGEANPLESDIVVEQRLTSLPTG